MAKENTENKPKPTTKKHEARLAREKRQKRLVTGIVGGVLVVVIVLVAYGILYNEVFKKNQAVAKVGNTKITVEQFVKRVQYERLSYVESFTQYAASGYASLFQSYLLEMQNTLDNYVQFGSDVLDKMIDEAVLSAKAKELGITITDEEIEKELERGFGFFPNGTPTPTATVEVVYLPTSTLSAEQLAIVTITPTPSPEPTETPEPTATTGPTDAVTETPAADLTATATIEPTATEIPPTPTPYTREGFESLYKTMLTNISSQFPYTEADFREYVTALLLNQKMYDYVTKDIPRDQEMVWARHILVATEEEAKTVLNRLNAGEDFAAVAAEVSTDTSNSKSGGDLGWFTRGQMVPAFEDAAFSLEIGQLSDPIQTDYGYHIIQVLGREVRTLTDEQLDTVKSYYFRKFIDDAKAEMTIKKYDIWAENVPSTPAIPEQYRITGQQ
jgi:parvulin-like peptidyl-prolyl isomerase